MWKIHPVFHVSLITTFVKDNGNVNLISVLNTSYPLETAPAYNIDKVMGSTKKDRKVL
jgi:hypothetical protein